MATAEDAFAHDLEVTIVSDATAAVSWSLHDDALERAREQHDHEVPVLIGLYLLGAATPTGSG